MAKFDKNIKNEFLNEDEYYDEDFYDEEDDYADDENADYDEEYGDEYSDSELADEEDEAYDGDEDDAADDFGADESEPASTGYEEKREENKAKWYVVHTYSGHENRVKVKIEKIVENRGMQDLIQCVAIPEEDVVELKDGQRKVKTHKMFPGYVLVKMVMTNESWYTVRNSQGVTGFVGNGTDPISLTDEEVRNMGIDKTTYTVDIEPGDTVKIMSGPFGGFMGIAEDVNMEKQIMKVRISMFGRETPVELEFGQVEKIS